MDVKSCLYINVDYLLDILDIIYQMIYYDYLLNCLVLDVR